MTPAMEIFLNLTAVGTPLIDAQRQSGITDGELDTVVELADRLIRDVPCSERMANRMANIEGKLDHLVADLNTRMNGLAESLELIAEGIYSERPRPETRQPCRQPREAPYSKVVSMPRRPKPPQPA